MVKEEKIVVKVLGINYRWPNIRHVSGIKKGQYNEGEKYYRQKLVLGGGNGTLVVQDQSSSLTLFVLIEGNDHPIRVDNLFRSSLPCKRLTAKIRRKIEAALPTEVEVVAKVGQDNNISYILSADSCIKWCASVSKLLK
jgi:hypothetical protein